MLGVRWKTYLLILFFEFNSPLSTKYDNVQNICVNYGFCMEKTRYLLVLSIYMTCSPWDCSFRLGASEVMGHDHFNQSITSNHLMFSEWMAHCSWFGMPLHHICHVPIPHTTGVGIEDDTNKIASFLVHTTTISHHHWRSMCFFLNQQKQIMYWARGSHFGAGRWLL